MSRRRAGTPDPVERERLAQLAALLSEQRGRLRSIGYGQAEDDCDRLAARLIAEVGRRELERYAFRAIPRGGLIVLGMLSYLLDLPASTLAVAEPVVGPLVLVDDCALTGARFGAALAVTTAPEIVFGHLYSTPSLRAAIEAAEPRVRRCLAVHDLADRTEDLSPEERELWRQRWRERLGSGRYAYGKVDPLAFPWTEPDRPLWNRAAGALETGWRLASPSACLRNRGRLGPPPAAEPRRIWKVGAAVASAELGGSFWLCALAGGEVIALEGTAADIWRRLARHGDPEIATVEVAEQHGVEPEVVRPDVEALATDLAARGLLERVDGRVG